ncbi:transposase [Paenibacillus sp. BSR1-1]|uniref:transposase n=1 Tax=Paenibacillus sp. BSR1-1 TaxID=3020845 RepID=UPI0025AFA6E7|nr:transposase [Paenibacillus sp. BSR1-1]MDN3016154.1 transposase [Paenibacillus sp. BSR1-1]
MAKYSEQFKLKLVKDYQEGKLSHKHLAEKHGMKDSTPIFRWVKTYEKNLESLPKVHNSH